VSVAESEAGILPPGAAVVQRSMAQRVAWNSLWLMGRPLLLNVLSIVTTGYIARTLGAADYGAFNLGYAQVALFLPITNLGLRAVAVRAIAEDRANAREIARSMLAARLILTLMAVLLACAWLAPPTYSATTRVIGLAAVVSMVLSSISSVSVDVFQGFERSRLSSQPFMVGGLALTVLSVLALFFGLGLPGFVTAYLVGHLLQFGLIQWTVCRQFFSMTPAWDWPRLKEIFHQARPFAALCMLGSFVDPAVVDVMVLGAVLGSGAVGPYTAALGLITRLLMIPLGIADAMYPAVAGGCRHRRDEVERTVRRCALNLILLTLPVALCLSFTAPTVLWILFGDEYLSATGALRVAAWLIPFYGMAYLVRECLCAVHRQGTVLRLTLVNLGLLVAFCAVLIPPFGSLGAAMAGVGREVVMAALWLRALSRQFGHPVALGAVCRVGVALAAMALPLVVLLFAYNHVNAVIAAVVSFACYGAAVVGLKLVDVRLPRRRGA
jgi:O-antigen/teichoic acid export membrane protein